MGFSGWTTSGGNPDPTAAFEMMLLIQCVSTNRRTLAQQAIGALGGITELGWDFDDTRPWQSWAMYRQGNSLVICIAGTANVQQWIGNITGILPQPYPNTSVLVHSYFQTNALTIATAIAAVLPVDWRDCDIFLTGQSLGAMVAFLIALSYKRTKPSQFIALMGFALAKVLTDGFAGPFPNLNFAIQNENDAVPFVPPNDSVYWLFGPANLWRPTVPTNFRHYERQYRMNSSGVIVEVASDTFNRDPTPGELASTAWTHAGNVYLQYLLTALQGSNPSPQDAALIPIAQILVNNTITNPIVDNLTWRTDVDVPFVNGQLFLNQDGGVINPTTPLTIVATRAELVQVAPDNPILVLPMEAFMATKAQFFFLDGDPPKWGISDTWYLATNPTQAEALTITQAYLNVRMPISGTNTLFDYARFSNIPANRVVKTVSKSIVGSTAPTTGTYPSTAKAPGTSDFAGTCLECVKVAANAQGRLFLRGIPDILVEGGGEYTPTPTWTTRFAAFVAALKANSYQFSAKGANVSVSSVISAITNPAPGNLQITLATAIFQGGGPPPVPIPVGTKLNATILGLQNNQQLNSPLVIVVDSTTTCHSLRPIAMSNLVLSPTAKLSYYAKAPVALTDMNITRAGDRKAGKPTKLVPGRRKNRVRG